jgi:glycerol-3-phosphate responsive antiterminator
VPVFYLRVDIDLINGAENFHEAVEHICFRKNRNGRLPKIPAATKA